MEYVKVGILGIFVIAFIYFIFKKDKSPRIPRMDEYTTERYLSCLTDIMNITFRDMFDAEVGERDGYGIIDDIKNDEISDIQDKITKKAYSLISDNMRLYLETYFGKEWLIVYVSSTIRNMVIDGTKELVKRKDGEID